MMTSTFQTGIDFEDRLQDNIESLQESSASTSLSSPRNNTSRLSSLHLKSSNHGERLPSSVNLVALRESFLSEAPFISNSNRTFWRRMVDNRNFQILLAASYYIIADCVSENSVVDVEKLQDIDTTNTPLIKTMATNISEMYYTIKLRERELLFAKLPEVLSFMVLTALRTAMPKHHRLCLSAQFREILIDWYCEVVGGLRFTNCRTNREWLFTDVFDAQIVTTAQLKAQSKGNSVLSRRNAHEQVPVNTSGPTSGTDPGTASIIPQATVSLPTTEHNTISVSKQTIGLSPLVSKYTSDASLADLQVKISLSHLSNRTLKSLDTISPSKTKGGVAFPPTSFHPGQPRLKKVDYEDVRRILKTSFNNRRKIMSTHCRNIREGSNELNRSRNELKAYLNDLKKAKSTEMLKAKTNWMNNSTFGKSL